MAIKEGAKLFYSKILVTAFYSNTRVDKNYYNMNLCCFKLRLLCQMAEWKVYRLTNHTKKQVYHGATKHSVEHRLSISHCVGKTLALCHWHCENDNIDVDTLAEGLTQREASARAHKEEKEYCQHGLPGYTCIETAGI